MNKLCIERIVTGLYETNTYLIYREDRDDALLIDPGDDVIKILKAIETSGKAISDIAITHGHFDHTLGAYYIKQQTGAKVTIHQADVSMLADPKKALAAKETGLDRFVPMTADAFFDTDRCIYIACGLPFRVIETPGHSPGSICLYMPEQNILFSGDTLFQYGFGRTDFDGGSVSQLKDSLQKLFTLPAETKILPGHGDPGMMQVYRNMIRKG